MLYPAELRSHLGERGIRTPDTLLAYMRFPGAPLKPLEHLSFLFYHDKVGHYAVTDKQCLSCKPYAVVVDF